jgi:nitroimidazol reductase NimA-like FMN-containing flavoprotein (pyridoxamine 5'-phosphate oxidase superfamily)
MSPDLATLARGIVDSNLYMTLATADEAGHPWVSPVYYAPEGYDDLYWVSNPDATHSRNLAVRPELAIVIFDSRQPIGTGQAVYMDATARLVEGEQAERGIEVFSGVSQSHGGGPFGMAEIETPGGLRLYRASVSRHYVLDPEASGDERTPVRLV